VKAVILAGGMGTRLSEETSARPKPMVEIGGRPILWHIMKNYSASGISEFIICCGYRGYMIKEFFANYFLHTSDVTFDLRSNQMEVHEQHTEPWRVTLVDTGEHTLTGGRLKRVREYVPNETFCFTYGDGLSNVDFNALIKLHHAKRAWATITAVQPPGRFGSLDLEPDGIVLRLEEKPPGDGAWINGGFFVLEPEVFDFIEGDATSWEVGPLQSMAQRRKVAAYRHYGFWHAMDTLRDKNLLEDLWAADNAPWKNW